ncbi:MAG: CueP family metal-binding protein [Bacillus sp. (in: Bacteria)]|nr:CueP family metal-binding protein [Bacillus sp. (in: firmicutes)]
MVEKDFHVYIEDKDRNIILDEIVTTLPNGFMDLWLPRDKKYTITISYEGMTAEGELSTFEGDDTCITTMQLM